MSDTLNLRLESISAHNLMAIGAAKVDFKQGDIYVVSGGNGAGKTTLSETLRHILQGNTPGKPLKDGQMAGFFQAKLATGEVLYWQFDEQQQVLTIKDPEGKPMGESRKKAFIRLLAGETKKPFDMDAFLKETAPSRQRDMLLQLVDLDLEGLELAIKDARDERTVANRRVKEQQARVQEYDPTLLAEQVEDASQVASRYAAMQQQNSAYDQKSTELRGLAEKAEARTARIAELEAEIKRLTAERDQYVVQQDEIQQWLDDEENAPYTQEQLQQTQQAIREADTKNEAIRHAQRMAQEQKALMEARKDAQAAEEAVKAAEQKRMDAVRQAELPGGLEFDPDGDGLLLNGQPLAQACASEVTICGLQIKARELGELKFIAFDGSHLDFQNTMKVIEWMYANGLQGMIEIAERTRERQALTITVAEAYYGGEE